MAERIGYFVSLGFHLAVGAGLFAVAEVRGAREGPSVVDIDYKEVPPPPAEPEPDPELEPEPRPEPEPKPEPEPNPEVEREPKPEPEPRKPVRITRRTHVAKRAPVPEEAPPSTDVPDEKETEPARAPLYAVSMEATVGSSTVAVPVAPRGVPRTKNAKKVVVPKARGSESPTRSDPVVTSLPRLVFEPRASYPREAREAGVEGRVVLVITVDAEGKVVQARVVEGLGYGLDEAALAAVRRFRFKPGTMNGRPAPMELRYRYTFILDD